MKYGDKIGEIAKKYNFAILLIMVLTLVCITNPDLLKIEKGCRIELSAIYDANTQHGQEIWLTKVLINNEEIPVSSLQLIENKNWKYAEDYDDYIFYPQKETKNNILIVEAETRGNIELIFAKNGGSGSVKITTKNKEDVIDLYSESSESSSYIIEEGNFTYAYENSIVQWIGIFTLVSIFAAIINTLLRKAPLTNKAGCVGCLLSFRILKEYELLNGFTIILLITCLIYYIYTSNHIYSMIAEGKKNIFIRLILHIYFVFALIANRIFMTGALMNFGVKEFGSFFVVMLALWPFGKILVYIMDKCQLYLSKNKIEITQNQVRVVRLMSFLIMFLILVLMTLGFYPAIIPVDGVSHWTQVVSYKGWGVQDNTSAAFTLFVRLFYKIWSSPYCFILFQLFLFSFIWSRVLTFFFTKGLPACVTYCISAIIAISPNNYMTLAILKTNPLYAILCMWVTYLLIKLVDNPEKNGMSVRFIIEMGVALSCLYLCRHNSFLAVYGTCAVLLIMFIKCTIQHKKLKINFIIPIFLTLIIVKTVTGPIYTHFDVIKNASGTVGYPLVSPLAVAYNNDVELSDDTLEYMNRIRPLEYWNVHNRYHGDTFAWFEPLARYDLTDGYGERFKYYFKMLFSRPDIVIKDRLDAIESFWNIFPSKGQGAYNEWYRLGISTNMPKELMPTNWNTTQVNEQFSAYYRETAFTKVPYALCQLSEKNNVLHPFVCRTGFSIVVMLFALYYTCITSKKKRLIAVIPMFGTMISLVLVCSWQLYQYYWVIHIIDWLLALYFVMPDDKQKIQ